MADVIIIKDSLASSTNTLTLIVIISLKSQSYTEVFHTFCPHQ